MTLIVALKYEEGVVVSSDSRVTFGELPLMREEEAKIEVIGDYAITGSGLSGPLHRILIGIRDSFALKHPSSFDELLLMCEDVVWDFHKRYAERIKPDEEDIGWIIVLVSRDRLCAIMEEGWCDEETNYMCTGSGELYAEYILRQRFRKNMNETDAKELALYCIAETSKIDPNVGGNIVIYSVTKSGAARIPDEEVNKIRVSIAATELGTGREVENIVRDIIEKRRWINTTFQERYNFRLFDENEFAISEIQKICANEDDFTNRIGALALLVDGIKISELSKLIDEQYVGSVNVLESFLKKYVKEYDSNLISNMRDIVTLRSKKMPIHRDDPKIIQVVLKWQYGIPPDWSSLWNESLRRYRNSLDELKKALSAKNVSHMANQ
jgi:20S proteasome alpha/beta subunit